MSEQHTDRRKSPRKRTLLGGKVVHKDGSYSLDCTIRDMSDTGAKIALPEGACIPVGVFLVAKRAATAYEASIVWIRGAEFGLQFLKTLPLRGESPGKGYFIKHLGMFAGPV